MTRKIKLLITSLIILIVFSLSTCAELLTTLTDEGGTLTIKITEDDVSTRTIVPSLSMEIATYDIYGQGPLGEAVESTGVIETTNNWSDLAEGSWDIQVDARNESGIIIATGQTTVEVFQGQVTNATVMVQTITGIGSINLSMTWPVNTLISPVISATLTPLNGSPITLPFIISGNTATYTSNNLTNGYYQLDIHLYESGEGDPAWGMTSAVRIVTGQSTEAFFDIQDFNVVTPEGNIQVQINADLQNPLEITLSGINNRLFLGSDMTVESTVSDTPDSYQWYLDGNLLEGETNSSITIGSNLSTGTYNLNLLVTLGNIYSSTGFSFSVSEAGAANILLIEDQTGFGEAAALLEGDGHFVTEVFNEYSNGYATLLNGAYIDDFDIIIWGERGSGSGTLLPQAVADSLEIYLQNGGNLIVTGYDTLGSPTDAVLAYLVRSLSPGDSASSDANWALATIDHFILNGPFGDYRGATFTATGYDDDILIPDTERGAIEIAAIPGRTSRIIFTDIVGGGSVGYWNGGYSGTSNAQPDFTNEGIPRELFRNWIAGISGLAPETGIEDTTWSFNYDWGATGSYSSSSITFNADGTFITGYSNTGTWVVSGSSIVFTYDSGTEYTGTFVTDTRMEGTMINSDGTNTGVWYTTLP